MSLKLQHHKFFILKIFNENKMQEVSDNDSEEDIDMDNSEEQLIRVKIIPRPTREFKKELERLVQNGK